jgi:flagellar assembly protein FliH
MMSSSNPKGGIKNIPPPEGHKSSPYCRFIPREELNSFSAWSPNNLGGSEPARGVHRHTQADSAPRPSASGTEDLAQVMHSAHQQGYQDGYRDGMQMSTQVGALLESLSAQLEDLQQDLARALAVSATHLARQIVRSELHSQPELVAQVANEALESLLLSARHVTLRVHPDDLPLVNQGSAEMLSARGARVVADTSLMRSSCMLESDIGVIDASMETRWRRAVAAIGCDEPWTPPAEHAATETAPQRDAPTDEVPQEPSEDAP